jgi:hypothetical protein
MIVNTTGAIMGHDGSVESDTPASAASADGSGKVLDEQQQLLAWTFAKFKDLYLTLGSDTVHDGRRERVAEHGPESKEQNNDHKEEEAREEEQDGKRHQLPAVLFAAAKVFLKKLISRSVSEIPESSERCSDRPTLLTPLHLYRAITQSENQSDLGEAQSSVTARQQQQQNIFDFLGYAYMMGDLAKKERTIMTPASAFTPGS